MLQLERPVLNIVGRLSGIATGLYFIFIFFSSNIVGRLGGIAAGLFLAGVCVCVCVCVCCIFVCVRCVCDADVACAVLVLYLCFTSLTFLTSALLVFTYASYALLVLPCALLVL
jgi:hypothetical protein